MCLFCKIAQGEIPASIVHENSDYLAFLDISQSTLGHTLVIPKKHMSSFLDADQTTLSEILKFTQDVSHLLMNKLSAKGINILSNANEVSGQTVEHFHIHVVPRYQHDELEFKFQKHAEYDLKEILERLK